MFARSSIDTNSISVVVHNAFDGWINLHGPFLTDNSLGRISLPLSYCTDYILLDAILLLALCQAIPERRHRATVFQVDLGHR
jgi:hypothetical protein